jgi:DNA-binding transcriptional LysR family regulator
VDLNLLVVLEALLDERNVTRAAVRLNKSQPSVSNGLSRLRQLFNDPLLQREGNGMRLTPTGRDLRPRVKDALDSIRALLARDDAFDPTVGRHRLRACSTENASLHFVPTLREQLRGLGVKADLSVHWPTTKEDALRQLSSGKFDLLLGSYLERSDEAERFYLYEEKAVFLLREGHPILTQRGVAAGGPVEAEAFEGYPVANGAYSGAAGRQFDAGMKRAGLSIARLNSMHEATMSLYYMLGNDTVALTSERMGAWLSRMTPLRTLTPAFDLPRFPVEMLVQKARVQEPWMNWFIGQVLRAVPDAYGVSPEPISLADKQL